MTTQVTILCRGPDAIKIEIQRRDADGKFTSEGSEEHRVSPGEFKDVYVHQHQSLQITEERD